MTVAQETGELRNPGHPGNEEFDTLIYGSPPLVYPAVLSQYVIYNTRTRPTSRDESMSQRSPIWGPRRRGPLPTRTYPSTDISAFRAEGAPSRSPFSRTATTVHSKTLRPVTSICANCWRHTGSSQRRLMSTFSTDPISARTTRGPSFISNT